MTRHTPGTSEGGSATRTHSDPGAWNLGAAERLSAEETNTLLERFQKHGDIEARNLVVQSNLRLVAYLAARVARRGMSRDELMSEGAAALIRAAVTFDTTRGVSFATYASRAIEHAMRRGLARAHEIITIPSAARRQHAKERREADMVFTTSGDRPVRMLTRGINGNGAQLHAVPIGARAEGDVGGYDPVVEQETPSTDDEVRSKVREAVAKLGTRRATVLSLRFGLDTGTPRSWNEVAAIANLPVREVKAIVSEAMRLLRVHLSGEQAEMLFPRMLPGLAA
jgi:RNA polymerase primary sigma factor